MADTTLEILVHMQSDIGEIRGMLSQIVKDTSRRLEDLEKIQRNQGDAISEARGVARISGWLSTMAVGCAALYEIIKGLLGSKFGLAGLIAITSRFWDKG